MTSFGDVQNDLKERDLGKFLALEILGEIAYLSEEKGLTQQELSELAGIPQKTISRLENGLDIPTFDTVGKLLKALGCVPKITFEYE